MLGSGIAMWQICCRIIVVSSSVGGVRSRCPCSGVWLLQNIHSLSTGEVFIFLRFWLSDIRTQLTVALSLPPPEPRCLVKSDNVESKGFKSYSNIQRFIYLDEHPACSVLLPYFRGDVPSLRRRVTFHTDFGHTKCAITDEQVATSPSNVDLMWQPRNTNSKNFLRSQNVKGQVHTIFFHYLVLCNAF